MQLCIYIFSSAYGVIVYFYVHKDAVGRCNVLFQHWELKRRLLLCGFFLFENVLEYCQVKTQYPTKSHLECVYLRATVCPSKKKKKRERFEQSRLMAIKSLLFWLAWQKDGTNPTRTNSHLEFGFNVSERDVTVGRFHKDSDNLRFSRWNDPVFLNPTPENNGHMVHCSLLAFSRCK